MKTRIAVAVLLLVPLVGLGYGGRQVWCSWKMDGEAIGGFAADTFGEYKAEVDKRSRGCTEVILVGLDGIVVQDPDLDTSIEQVTGEMLSGPITVTERPRTISTGTASSARFEWLGMTICFPFSA